MEAAHFILPLRVDDATVTIRTNGSANPVSVAEYKQYLQKAIVELQRKYAR